MAIPSPEVPLSQLSLEEIQAQFDDNSGYAEVGSPSQCRRFITVATVLLRRTPDFVDHSLTGERISLNVEMIQQAIKDARAWLAVDGVALERGGSRTTYADTSGIRPGTHSIDRRNWP